VGFVERILAAEHRFLCRQIDFLLAGESAFPATN
jgi:hypothetical protein